MYVCGLPAPSRIDEQEQAEERREREFILNAPHQTASAEPHQLIPIDPQLVLSS